MTAFRLLWINASMKKCVSNARWGPLRVDGLAPNRGYSSLGVLITLLLEFFLNGTELSLNSVISVNSGNLINH